ncbi:MAG: YgjV family protein [Thalassotalea sp.]
MDLNIAQAFGLLSFVFGTYTFLQKNDQRLKVSMLCLFTCQSIHFFLMGSPTAAAANILNLLRTFISLKFNKPWLGALFIAANIAWGVYLYQSMISILPTIGACLGTYAVFYLQAIKMRLAFILAALCWITHNIVVNSVGGILLESIVIIANTITAIRIYLQAEVVKTV